MCARQCTAAVALCRPRPHISRITFAPLASSMMLCTHLSRLDSTRLGLLSLYCVAVFVASPPQSDSIPFTQSANPFALAIFQHYPPCLCCNHPHTHRATHAWRAQIGQARHTLFLVNSFLIASLPRCAEPSASLSPTHEDTQPFLFFPLPVCTTHRLFQARQPPMRCDAMRVCVPFTHSFTHRLIASACPFFSLALVVRLRAVCLTQPSILSLSLCVCVCVCMCCVRDEVQ
mmetsp:Transcript_31757/g.78722  ORF Transcript_31757/g.78722 Transcript_31757/m.78722 type:complete len:231 (+) Transcript_31757:129-821(+)